MAFGTAQRLVQLDPRLDAKVIQEVTGVKPPYDFGGEFKKSIAARLKPSDIEPIRMLPTHVLVALYVREKVSASLYSAAQTQDEDIWQGKVGLVLKLGPKAFQSDERVSFDGFVPPVIGEWAVFRNSDGWDLGIVPFGEQRHIRCRLIADEDIKAVVPRPEMIH